ncbi:hypothetical protein Acr_05g0001370 [Actinidia rufa]|uniref:Uncharacterized protein n=1 Tax=Actinidia rufa TaxID=165716 RepID=A0A7J0EJ62_9ERIC|nr:hypothetical protein Acr_05g0001370 [Actinidia rufa]
MWHEAAEVGEGPRHDGRRSEEGSEMSGVSGQEARGHAAVHPAPRISLPHVPRRRPLPDHCRSARPNTRSDNALELKKSSKNVEVRELYEEDFLSDQEAEEEGYEEPSSGQILEALHTDPASSLSLDKEKSYKVSKPQVSASVAFAKLIKKLLLKHQRKENRSVRCLKNLQKRADQVDIGIAAAAEATVDLLQGSIPK